MTSIPLPANLLRAAAADRHPRRRDWMERLPSIVAGLAQRWELQVGEPFQPGGETAWVAPVRDAAGTGLVLKVGWHSTESEHEAAGLVAWSDRGAVRLLAAHRDGETSALLLERCDPGTELGQAEPEPRQDEIVGGILCRLWHEPPEGHPFRPLEQMCDEWADEREAEPDQRLDPGLVREGLALWRSLPASADREVLLATDLHAGNILASRREPWLVIDPKPYVGDPAYDPVQHMLNCPDRLLADPGDLTARMADFCGVDRDRLGQWLLARSVVESTWWPLGAELARRLTRSA